MTTPSHTADMASPPPPTAADYYGSNRGGGLFSEAISQRLGAAIAVFAHRHRLAPTVLTVANLGLGCAVSFAVIAAAGPVADGRIGPGRSVCSR